MLFGLIDFHDIAALLEISLKVVATQMQLQQAEANSSVFLLQGGHCFMEERMYHAQMEVSLFSAAIANLCEVLNTRGQPCQCEPILSLKSLCLLLNIFLVSASKSTLSAVSTVGYARAYQTPSSLNFKRFQPTKDIQDKCRAWLITSSPFHDTMQVDSDVSQTPPDSPHHHEYPLRVSDCNIPRVPVF